MRQWFGHWFGRWFGGYFGADQRGKGTIFAEVPGVLTSNSIDARLAVPSLAGARLPETLFATRTLGPATIPGSTAPPVLPVRLLR